MGLPEGSAGTKATLQLMSGLVKEYKKDPNIRDKAATLTKYLEAKNWTAEVHALWNFVKTQIRYTRDIRNVETVYTPDQTLSQGYGDCDDKATLLASLLEAIGHPTRFVAVGFQPGVFSHVYVETRIGNNWLPLETTENVPMGWAPPNPSSRMVVNN